MSQNAIEEARDVLGKLLTNDITNFVGSRDMSDIAKVYGLLCSLALAAEACGWNE